MCHRNRAPKHTPNPWKARKLTRLKTKREIVDAALELLVRSESRKGILRHYGAGIWKGDLKAMRRNRA
jgi:Arc/MetJ family transcription regulator